MFLPAAEDSEAVAVGSIAAAEEAFTVVEATGPVDIAEVSHLTTLCRLSTMLA